LEIFTASIHDLWGSQSWLQPAFSRLFPLERALVSDARDTPRPEPPADRLNAVAIDPKPEASSESIIR
jgi:hypothetical protein